MPTNFPIKTDLPSATQKEIDRVEAIASAQRTTSEANFLTALAPYLTNEIFEYDEDENILRCAGNTAPTDALSGFSKGAIFTKKDAAADTKSMYENIGTTASCAFNLVGESAAGDISLASGKVLIGQSTGLAGAKTLSGDVTVDVDGVMAIGAGRVTAAMLASALDLSGKDMKIAIKSGTPVNAVASAKVLTVSDVPANNETVSIGGVVYTFQNSIGAAVAATGLLTVGGTPTEADTITIGSKTYKFRVAIGAGAAATKTLTFTDQPLTTETMTIGATAYAFKTALTEAKATSTLTLSANATDGNSVTIGSTKYTFKETLVAAYDVLIGASASDTIDNLIAAINKAAGEGSTYGTGTVVHPSVTAAVGASDTMGITAKVAGVAGNSIATTELSAVASWTDTTMANGVDAIANEILIGGTAEASIDNAIAALTGAAGAGTTYSTGTTQPTGVTCTKADTDKIVATASAVGFAGNSIAIAETLTNAAWAGGATFLSGGVDAQAANDVLIGADAEAAIDNLVLAITGGAGEGTNYGTGTVASTQVTAVKASASTMTVTASNTGDAGNTIATTENGSNTSFGNSTLTGGEGAEAANDILIGVNAEACIDNLVAAINHAAGEGTTYGSGTVANPSVTAAKTTASTMTATAKIKGVSGDLIALAESGSNMAWAGGATFLSGGVDGTVGAAREVYADASYLYITTAANTIADANWRRVALGSAY